MNEDYKMPVVYEDSNVEVRRKLRSYASLPPGYMRVWPEHYNKKLKRIKGNATLVLEHLKLHCDFNNRSRCTPRQIADYLEQESEKTAITYLSMLEKYQYIKREGNDEYLLNPIMMLKAPNDSRTRLIREWEALKSHIRNKRKPKEN